MMANNESGEWPLPKFSFRVKWGDAEFIFQEVSGLASETQVIEYRGGTDKVFSTVKMPGIKKFSNVTLKRGIFKSDSSMWEKYNQIKMNTIKREQITISLLDEAQNPAMSWLLINAFPVKITVTDIKSEGYEFAVESLEIAHEGLKIVEA